LSKTIIVPIGALLLVFGLLSGKVYALQDTLQNNMAGGVIKKWDPVKVGLLSAAIPGAGQAYTGHYIKAGAFLASEIATASVARFWYTAWEDGLSLAEGYRLDMKFAKSRSDSLLVDERVALVRFDAKKSRFGMYNALSWVVGAYVFNVADALKCSKAFDDDLERSALKAAWLSAIPALGLGQIYNGELSKAGLVIMTQVSLGVIALNEHRLMKKAGTHYLSLVGSKDSAWAPVADKYQDEWEGRQSNAFKNRNSYLWYSLFFYFYGMLDAVVDAHLHDYTRKMKVYPDLVPQQGEFGLKMDYTF